MPVWPFDVQIFAQVLPPRLLWRRHFRKSNRVANPLLLRTTRRRGLYSAPWKNRQRRAANVFHSGIAPCFVVGGAAGCRVGGPVAATWKLSHSRQTPGSAESLAPRAFYNPQGRPEAGKASQGSPREGLPRPAADAWKPSPRGRRREGRSRRNVERRAMQRGARSDDCGAKKFFCFVLLHPAPC